MTPYTDVSRIFIRIERYVKGSKNDTSFGMKTRHLLYFVSKIFDMGIEVYSMEGMRSYSIYGMRNHLEDILFGTRNHLIVRISYASILCKIYPMQRNILFGMRTNEIQFYRYNIEYLAWGSRM